MALANATIILPIPGHLIVIGAATVLDPLAVGLVAGIGSAVGEFSGYALGLGGRGLMTDSNRFEAARRMYVRFGLWSIFIFAATPLPFDIIGIVSGLLKVRAVDFFVLAAAGKIALNLVLAYTGDASLTFLTDILQGRINVASVLFLTIVGVFVLLSLAYWRLATQRVEEEGA